MPGRFLNAERTARLTRANDPARGLIYCQRCGTDRRPVKGTDPRARGYACGKCGSIKIDMIPGKEPTGRWAI